MEISHSDVYKPSGKTYHSGDLFRNFTTIYPSKHEILILVKSRAPFGGIAPQGINIPPKKYEVLL